MKDVVYWLLCAWDTAGALALAGAGLLGLAWCLLRRYWIEHEDPRVLLRNRFDGLTRWLLLHRRSPKTFPLSLGLLLLGFTMHYAVNRLSFCKWAFQNAVLFLVMHAAMALLPLLIWFSWDRSPSYVKSGDGRADAQFRDVPEEWGECNIEDGRRIKDSRPTVEILVYRSPSRLARRILSAGQRFKGFLTLLSLRWDILCRHIFMVGPQGSGKTASFFGAIMHSSLVAWVYQDSKAELPFKDDFPDRPVFGLDVRGHETRSGVWNPMEEIRGPEDFDLIVDYLFPSDPNDRNKWVRDMARVLFGKMLRMKRWASIQELARELRETRLEALLAGLDPIYLDTMKDPKSQAIVLTDLVVGLGRWETERVRAITEGPSTVTLDDYIAKGGYVMNCEDSDALKIPVHVFWAMLLGRLRNRPEGSSPLLLLLDEFGDCGRIPNIQRALVLLRSKGVSIVAGIQNLGLLQNVYPQEWRAVMEGFGTRIWLARNLEDDLRQKLSQALGKLTRRVPPASKNAKETEKEVDLMPMDAWARWSENRVALGRLHGFTYWLPVAVPIPRTPLGPVLAGGDPWADSEAERRAAEKAALEAAQLPEWCLQVPTEHDEVPSPEEAASGRIEKGMDEGDWL